MLWAGELTRILLKALLMRVAARLVSCGFMVVSYLATHVRFRIASDNPGPNPFDNWRRRTLSNRYGTQVGASLSSSTRTRAQAQASPSAGRGAIEALKAARRAVPSVPPPPAPPQAASPAAAGDGPAAAAAAAAGSRLVAILG